MGWRVGRFGDSNTTQQPNGEAFVHAVGLWFVCTTSYFYEYPANCVRVVLYKDVNVASKAMNVLSDYQNPSADCGLESRKLFFFSLPSVSDLMKPCRPGVNGHTLPSQ